MISAFCAAVLFTAAVTFFKTADKKIKLPYCRLWQTAVCFICAAVLGRMYNPLCAAALTAYLFIQGFTDYYTKRLYDICAWCAAATGITMTAVSFFQNAVRMRDVTLFITACAAYGMSVMFLYFVHAVNSGDVPLMLAGFTLCSALNMENGMYAACRMPFYAAFSALAAAGISGLVRRKRSVAYAPYYAAAVILSAAAERII